jgi:hypothetical protein
VPFGTHGPCAVGRRTNAQGNDHRAAEDNPAFYAVVWRLMPRSQTNSSCLRRFANSRCIKTRLGRCISAKLDTSNGCQDYAVLPYAGRLRPKALARQGHAKPKPKMRRSSTRRLIAH